MNTFGMIAIAFVMAASPAPQWLKHPTAGMPRTADGKPNLSAPAPKTADGKPDITGLWKPTPGYVGDITRGLQSGDVPYQPWAEALFKQRRSNETGT